MTGLRTKGAGVGALRGAAGFATVATLRASGVERRVRSAVNGERRIGAAFAVARRVPLTAGTSLVEGVAAALVLGARTPARACVVDAHERTGAAFAVPAAVVGDRFALDPMD
jgi:hypothetical protein